MRQELRLTAWRHSGAGVGATDAVERYSPATDSWTAMASLPEQTGLGESVAAYGDRIASFRGSEIMGLKEMEFEEDKMLA